MKHIFYFVLICAIMSCSPKNEKLDIEADDNYTEQPDQSTVVKALKIEKTVFYHDLVSNGTIQSARTADLRFNTAEIISKIYVKNGERVQQGQPLAELNRFRLGNSLQQAADQFERAKLDLQDVLIGLGYASGDSANIPEDVMKIARVKSNYTQNLVNLRNAEEQYENAALTAPFTGTVANLFSKEYNIATTNETFCSIIDNQRAEVVFNILENEIAFVSCGDKVKISPYAINNYSSEGTISEINPVVDKNGMLRVKAILASNSQIIDGMNVKVLIQIRIDEQLVIPKNALVLRTNRKVVFTIKNGIAVWNYVITTLENSTGYVVTEGLQPGDSIIYDGNINLAHDVKVVIN